MDLRKIAKNKIENSDISIRQLALKSGVRRQSIMKFLKGGNIHLKNLDKIFKALGYKLEVSELSSSVRSKKTFAEHLKIPEEKLASLCKKFGITHFALFGSVLRDDFKADSDIDVLIRLNRDVTYFELLEIEDELKKLFHTRRKLDILTETALSPLIADEIKKTQEVLYDEAA